MNPEFSVKSSWFKDHLKGLVFGQAVGDALGLGAEFMSKTEVASRYGETGLHSYSQIIQDRHRRNWPIGSWTDDTDQMLCIFDSLLENHSVDIYDIAHRIHSWVKGGGRGIGQLTSMAVSSNIFLSDPHSAAKEAWIMTAKRAASNGGVMRTSILGAWEYTSLEKVKENAERVCRITHYDPRCVGSCVAVSIAISLLLQGETEIKKIFDSVIQHTSEYSPEIIRFLQKAREESIESLNLDEGYKPREPNCIGYTFKAMSAGFWSLMHASSFEQGILQIVNEGGDADTNAAVAGAMLGARDGFDCIPYRLTAELQNGSDLERRVNELLERLDQ